MAATQDDDSTVISRVFLKSRAVAKSGNRLTDGHGLTKKAQVRLWDRGFDPL